MSEAQSQSQSDPAGGKPKKKRRLLKVIIALLVVTLMGVACLPMLLSGPFKGVVVGQINNQLNGSATIDSMSLAWFSGQQVNGLKINDVSDQTVVDIEKIDLPDVSLWGLISGNRDMGNITIHINNIKAVVERDGKLNLEKLAKQSSSTSSSTSSSSQSTTPSVGEVGVAALVPEEVAAKVQLVIDKLTYESPDDPSATISDFRVDVAVDGSEPIVGKLATTLAYGPLRGTASSDVTIDKMANLSGTRLTMDVTPQAWTEFAQQSKAKLLKPFGVSLSIPTLKVPALAGKAGLKDLMAQVNLEITDVLLVAADEKLGTLQLSGTQLAIDADGTAKPVTASFKGEVTQSNQPGKFDLNITLENVLEELSKPQSDYSNVKARIVGDVSQVGLAIFDELFQQHGLIRNAIGPTLTASIESQLQYDATGIPQGYMNLKATAQYLNADMALSIGPDGVSQKSPGVLQMQITPGLYAAATQIQPDQPNLLNKTFGMVFKINTLHVPRVSEQWEFQNASIDMALQLDDVFLRAKPDVESKALIKLGKPSWTVKSKSVGKAVAVNGGFEVSIGGALPGKFAMDLTADNLLKDSGKLNTDAARIKGHLTLLPLQFPQVTPFLSALKFNVNKLVNHVIGTKQSIEMDVRLLPEDTNAVATQVPNMQVQFKTSSFAINTNVKATIKQDLLMLDPSSELDVKLTPELFAYLTKPREDDKQTAANQTLPTPAPATGSTTQVTATTTPAQTPALGLAKAVMLKGRVEELRWPLDPSQNQQASIAVSLTADRIEPTGLPGGLSTSMRDLKLMIGKGSPVSTIPVKLTAQMYEQNKAAGNLDVTLALMDLLNQPAASDLALSMKQIPVALIDSLSGMDGKLYALLGNRIDELKVQASGPLDQNMAVEVSALGENLNVQTQVQLSEQAITLKPGSTVALQVTPQSLGLLNKAMNPQYKASDSTWQLTKPTQLKLTLPKLVLPKDASKINQTQLGVDVTASTMSFAHRTLKTTLSIADLKLALDAQKLTDPIFAQLDAKINGKDENGKAYQSEMISKTTILNLINDKGEVDAVHATVKTNTAIPKLPIELLDSLLNQQGKLAGIIGPTARVSAKGSYPGDLNLEFVGDNTSISLPAKIDADRKMTLREDAVARIKVNKQTAEALLKYGNPILIDATESREPVMAIISAKTFSAPLANFDIKNVVADIQLKLGTISLKDSWLLNSMGEGLGKLDKAFSISSKQDAVFTPLTITMRDGITQTNDMWMQINDVKVFGKSRIDTLTIGTQGSVDLIKSTANMGLGLPAETFYSFGSSLRKYIKPGTVFEMPLSGPLNGVKLQGLDKLAISLAATVAGGELGGNNGGLGALIGQVAGQLTTGKSYTEYQSKRTWPNKPVIKQEQTPTPTESAAPSTEQQTTQTQQAQTQQLDQPKQPAEEKSEKQKRREEIGKTVDSLIDLFSK
ncbi:MAG: hypothetical protein CMJ19_14215 [Phycisphaeraceae bacterium]|nr:hypothetical protein [Phycisphaeraceae bacterium]